MAPKVYFAQTGHASTQRSPNTCYLLLAKHYLRQVEMKEERLTIYQKGNCMLKLK